MTGSYLLRIDVPRSDDGQPTDSFESGGGVEGHEGLHAPPAPPRTDSEIVASLVAGRSEGGAQLVRRHEKHVRSVLARVLGGGDDALADLVQEVFLAAIQGIGRLEQTDALRSWLAGISTRIARSEIRRRRKQRRFLLVPYADLEDAIAAAADPASADALGIAERILDEIPADERVPYLLHYVDEKQLVDVAHACDVSLATVKRRIQRAKEKLTARARRHPELAGRVEGRAERARSPRRAA